MKKNTRLKILKVLKIKHHFLTTGFKKDKHTFCLIFAFCFRAFGPVFFSNKLQNQNFALDLYFWLFPHYFLDSALFFKLQKSGAVESRRKLFHYRILPNHQICRESLKTHPFLGPSVPPGNLTSTALKSFKRSSFVVSCGTFFRYRHLLFFIAINREQS